MARWTKRKPPPIHYIYDEEIIYDTLYLQDNHLDELLTKDELLEAFQKSGVGQLFYKKGHYYLTGNDENYKLDNTDLQMLFTAAQYEAYRKAKRNYYTSIPLFVAGSGAAVIAGIGLYQFFSSFILFAKVGSQFDDQDRVTSAWKASLGGVMLLGGGVIGAAAFFAPAIVLNVKSKVQLNNIANEFSQSNTSLRLTFGARPAGIGVTLSF